MNVIEMLAELRNERSRLDEAIIVMQRLAVTNGVKRRGRPPKWMTESRVTPITTAPRKRKRFSAETRKRMAESQRKRWAKTA